MNGESGPIMTFERELFVSLLDATISAAAGSQRTRRALFPVDGPTATSRHVRLVVAIGARRTSYAHHEMSGGLFLPEP